MLVNKPCKRGTESLGAACMVSWMEASESHSTDLPVPLQLVHTSPVWELDSDERA
jgi:hypothetical protein